MIALFARVCPATKLITEDTGTTDSTAATVPGARVTVKNLDTGLTRGVPAGADGYYRVLALPIGRYSLTAEAPKFARFERERDVEIALERVNGGAASQENDRRIRITTKPAIASSPKNP